MSVPEHLAPLFEPFDFGPLSLRNRFVMAPMTRWKSPEEIPGADVAAYYRRRAEHGVGLIITEGTTIDHPVSSQSARTPAFHGPALDPWRRVVDEVHGAGGKIIPQIWHVGGMRHPKYDYPNRDRESATPSGLFAPGAKRIAEPLSTQNIADIVESYARAAAHAHALGFDGVEVHGAHGYLIDQFLWGAINERDDEYGGDAVGRGQFAVDVVRAIRAAIPSDFPLILRISQWKQQDYTARLAETPEALAAIFRPIAEAGVDIFHCSQRRWWESEFVGSDLNLAGWIKQLLNRPTITVGSVGLASEMSLTNLDETSVSEVNLAPLAERLGRGEFDLVAVGRALLADPRWVEFARRGDHAAITRFDKSALDELR